MKLTPRQSEVMAHLSLITTDGSRHEPQFRLGEKNVSLQVRSLLNYKLIALKDGRLTKVERAVRPQAAAFDTEATVSAMRDLLSDEA